MSEMAPQVETKRVFRVRLTGKEAMLISEALNSYSMLMDQKQKEYEHRKFHVECLRKDLFRKGNLEEVMKELKEERQKLAIDSSARYYSRQTVAQRLAKRLHELQNGRKLHSANISNLLL